MIFTKKGTTLKTNKEPLNVNDKLPTFNLTNENDIQVTSAQIHKKMTLISVVPNINTPICSLSTRKFNKDVNEFPNVDFYTISTNTPAEQQKWCALAGVTKMVMLSDQNFEFGKAMGLFIETNQIDARSVWCIDQTGKIVYRELVKELSQEPNYSQVLNFLRKYK